MSEPTAPLPPPVEPPPSPRTGRLLGGVLLVLLGVAWLLESLDVVQVPWDLFLPGALVALGAILVVNARTGAGHRGMIALGVVLTVLLFIGTAISFPFGGGIGERTIRPTGDSVLEPEYELGVGKLTLDLTGFDFAGTDASIGLEARVGIGQLVVIVPTDLPIRVEARSGLGNVVVFDEEQGGIDAHLSSAPEGAPLVTLEATVGIGEVSVERG